MRTEPTRVRENGTHVTLPTNPASRIVAVRNIKARGQYAKVDGIAVDLFTASAIVAVYDALNPDNQRKFASLRVDKMARIAFQLLK